MLQGLILCKLPMQNPEAPDFEGLSPKPQNNIWIQEERVEEELRKQAPETDHNNSPGLVRCSCVVFEGVCAVWGSWV